MKKSVLLIISLVLFNLTLVSAACTLDVTMINQDPYPAIPGNYVKLMFQVTGVADPNCETVSFELLENYPISFDPEDSSRIQIKSGTYQKDYSSYLMLPYKVRIDENALDGENKIEVKFGSGDITSAYQSKTFYIEVEDSRAEFEVHIDEYSYDSKELTIEILNIAENDIEALTLEIPKQENIDVRGTNRVIVGDLDSNEYTTADFTADIEDGEIIVKILYTNQIGSRIELEKTLVFDSSYFVVMDGEGQKSSTGYVILILFILGLAIWWFLKKKKKKKNKMRRQGKARL